MIRIQKCILFILLTNCCCNFMRFLAAVAAAAAAAAVAAAVGSAGESGGRVDGGIEGGEVSDIFAREFWSRDTMILELS